MNLNFGEKNEYDLNSSLIQELINLYGIQVKLIIQERVNNDQVVFGDYSHLFSSGNTHEIYALPENSEGFETSDFGFNQFGLMDFNQVNLFIHRESIKNIPGVEPINISSMDYEQKMKPNLQDIDFHLVGHLLVLPSGKIMEITHQEHNVPGINNIFTSKNQKSTYKLTCVPFNNKLENELDDMDFSVLGSSEERTESYVPDLSIEDYFEELNSQRRDQNYEAEINDTSTIKIREKGIDKDLTVPLIDKSEKQAWD